MKYPNNIRREPYENQDISAFNIGDIVEFKTWEMLVIEYGFREDNLTIAVPFGFTQNMRHLINHKYKISSKYFNTRTGSWLYRVCSYRTQLNINYSISKNMLKYKTYHSDNLDQKYILLSDRNFDQELILR